METSENGEAVIVAVGSAAGAVAAYLAAQPIPDRVKLPVCTVLSALSVGLLAYWKARVNVKEA